MTEIHVAKDLDELNRFAAERFVSSAKKAIEATGRFTVALAGGSTPKSLYRLLAGSQFRDRVDWSRVFFFFGDERRVGPDHPDSNFRMTKENLFDPLGTARQNIFRWPTEKPEAEDGAADYEKTIKEFFNADPLPRFDLILLGLGADGHTASLFPYSPALKEVSRLAVTNPVEKLATDRLTLTFPVINNAANIILLVSGAEKASALKEILEGKADPEKYPAQMVRPVNGDLVWLIDNQANELLTTNN
jgi:6-phosphogluconolactonase